MTLFKMSVKKWILSVIIVCILICTSLFFIPKEDTIKLLYVTNGDTYDLAAFDNFEQSLQANLRLEQQDVSQLSWFKLQAYDAIYLDPGLHKQDKLMEQIPTITSFVERGGHLFLENVFASDFSLELLGAEQVVSVPAVAEKPVFTYPAVDVNMAGMQKTFLLFTESYFKRETMNSLPGFDWGYGLVPSTAETLVELNGLALCTVNRVGSGTVMLSSSFMPNRYFPTGYDLVSGMDKSLGFDQLAAQYNGAAKPVAGTAYFNKRLLPLEPYFHFAFAAANMQFRSDYISFISKEKLGYSIKKILGPYGRPAMAFQNHFEALQAIGQKDGIQWAELLKKYNEIPSFTLVRSAFTWGQWRESLTVQLNVGTNAQPQFVGELPGSGYSSGLHLRSEGQPLRLAVFPPYRDLASAIEEPYRAFPALADLDGDGRQDLLVGSADGFVYAYTNLGPPAAAYHAEPPPGGVPLPDTFGEARKLELESGTPLQPYSTIHAADVNGDDLPDLVVSDASGVVRLLPGLGSGRFGKPATLRAGPRVLQVQGPAAVAVADVNGDGVRDLVVGDADGGVHLFEGADRAGLEWKPGRLLLQLPAGGLYAAPAVRDMSGDGRPDLVVGSNEGDLRVFIQGADGSWTDRGPLEGTTLNQMGNHALVAGHYSVPLWTDINHDGTDDLIVGGVEFGSPIAIDDPAFPYKEELNEFIQYTRDHHLELDPHLFFHSFKNDEQERQEIALHKQTFEKLGIPWTWQGTNQHTWRINFPDRQQSLQNERNQGIWFNFGFLPAHSEALSRPEGIWSLPFLLRDTEKVTESSSLMLIHTPTPVLRLDQYSTTDIFQSMAELDMPIDYFEHIEYHFPAPTRVAELAQFAAYFDKLRTEHDYNFMTETQMAQSFLTAMKGEIKVQRSWAVYLMDKLKDLLASTNPHWNVTLVPAVDSIPDQAGPYKDTLGVVIEKGKKFLPYNLKTSSIVYNQEASRLYMGVSDSTSVGIQPGDDELHVIRSNVPFDLVQLDQQWEIAFKANGMQQIKLYSPSLLQIEGPDLKIEHNEQDQTYTITHYGDAIQLSIAVLDS